MNTTPEAIAAVRNWIRENWPKTILQPSALKGSQLKLPVPCIVPCADEGHFRTMYYWDTWFTAEGMIHDGYLSAIRHSAENFMHVVETLGFIPNAMIEGCHRTQLPTAARLYRLVYRHTGDRVWLARAAKAVEAELAFFQVFRGAPDGLNRPGHHATPAEIRNFYWAMRDRIKGLPHRPAELYQALAHLMAECEVWDFSPRFEMHGMDWSPVDLNAELYEVEEILAWMLEELDDANAPRWHQAAARRREKVESLLWDDARGWYMDWNHVERRRGSVASAAGLWPLASGVASPERAARVRENLPLVECEWGITTCEPGPRPPGQTFQWDDPNAWPPMQWIAILGLDRYGFHEDADRIARKYVETVTRVFARNGKLWEKYNAHTGDIDVADEYPMPPMLDWTAGMYVACCERLQAARTSP